MKTVLQYLISLLAGSILLVAGGFGGTQSLGVAAPPQLAQAAPTATLAPMLAAPAGASQAAGGLETLQATFEQIYTAVNPSVVNIHVIEGGTNVGGGNGGNGGNGNGQPGGNGNPFGFAPQAALGSGFVWDANGDIVTNNHVVDGATKITVTFADGTTVEATRVGNDPNADLAVIKVNVAAGELHPVQLADSTQVKVGQVAIAIGNPFGLSGTMTQGIISGLSRSLPVANSSSALGSSTGTYSIPDIIQTDAAINPGNSGGVLVDDQGHVLGVTAAIESQAGTSSGVGFVIPAAIVQKVVPALIQSGHYDHPWLGITGTTLTPDLAQAMNLKAEQQGVLVISTAANSPAAKAGVQGSQQPATINGQAEQVGGDVITALNGQTIKRFEDLASYLLDSTQAGQSVTLTVLRQGQTQTLQVTLGVLPTP